MKIRKWLRRKYIAFRWRNAVSLKDLCDAIRPYAYAFVKVDVPYMPDDFPKHVPIGRDADILCSFRDFPKIKREIIKWSRKYEKQLAVRVIDENSRFRLRLEYRKQLVYLVDVVWTYSDTFPDEFTDEALSNRIERNGYYVLDTTYELLIRAAVYKANPEKRYHLEYMITHLSEYDNQLGRRWLKDGGELFAQISEIKRLEGNPQE